MKKLFLIVIVVSFIVLFGSCTKEYKASIKVTNTGNTSVIVAIDDTQAILQQTFIYKLDPDKYDIYELVWTKKNPLIINFLSYVPKHDDEYYAQEVITLHDGDFIERTINFHVIFEKKQ